MPTCQHHTASILHCISAVFVHGLTVFVILPPSVAQSGVLQIFFFFEEDSEGVTAGLPGVSAYSGLSVAGFPNRGACLVFDCNPFR